MFDLEQAIGEWRRSLAVTPGLSAEVLDELESHLREDVQRETTAGQPPEEAFRLAVVRLGSAGALATEFAKVTRPAPASWVPAWVVLGVGCLAALVLVVFLGLRVQSE